MSERLNNNKQNIQHIDINQIKLLNLDDNKYIVIDLRDEEEYKKFHIKNAVNIPFRFITKDQFRKRYGMYRKSKTFVLYCSHGGNSMRAALMLAEMGFKIINLRGGTSRLEITQWALRLCALADMGIRKKHMKTSVDAV